MEDKNEEEKEIEEKNDLINKKRKREKNKEKQK